MLKNYFITAIRSIRRYKVFTLINVAGLAIGLAVCMIIIMTVMDQLRSDRYNTDAEVIYRVITRQVNSPAIFGKYATTTLPLSFSLKENFTGIDQVVRIRRGFGRHWLDVMDAQLVPVGGFYTDPGFFRLFQYPVVQGNPATMLSEPYSVVLTEEAARKVFGTTQVMDSVLDMGNLGKYRVTGLVRMKDLPTHISFEAIASISTIPSLEKAGVFSGELDNWHNYTGGHIYLKLAHGTDPAAVESYLATLKKEHWPDEPITYQLQNLTDIKPGPVMSNEIGPFMPWLIIYILDGLGAIIMISSCFNYINLSIARSLSRAREVGVRKVNGAGRRQIVAQFLIESVIIALLALGVGTLFLFYLEPAFEQLNFAHYLHWQLSHDVAAWGVVLLFTVGCGLVAGLVPSLVMSNIRPSVIIKTGDGPGMSRLGMRKFLIVAQFSLSLVFIISILLVYHQVRMMTGAQLGFQPDNVLMVPYEEDSYDQLRHAVESQSYVKSISRSSHAPSTGNNYGGTLLLHPDDPQSSVNYFAVDGQYLENMNIPLMAGRTFHENTTGQESEIILNEQAVKHFGFSSATEAIGETLYSEDSLTLTIIGVVPDYHHEGLMTRIEPMALRNTPDMFNYLQIAVVPGHRKEALDFVTAQWKSIYPGIPTEIHWMNDMIRQFYDLIFGDLMRILLAFSVIAVVIACLGLLGIVTYMTSLRIREISIRKVLGAENRQLIVLLSWQFLRLVILSIVVAIPLAYFLNRLWLENMAYRINMSPWYFIMGSGGLIFLAVLTIGSQAVRALRVNPADNLRTE